VIARNSQTRVARAVIVACTLLAWCSRAFALNPSLDISQYAHTSWKIRDGFFKGFITSFAQGADGYLWLGSEFGLLRFDGVRFVTWQPPAGQSLPDTYIRSLLSARDGTLWIGTRKGMASWKNGTLTRYPQLDGHTVNALVEDREGTLWIGSSAPANGRLCAIRKGTLQCYAEDGRLGDGVYSLYPDRGGAMWAGGVTGLWRLNHGSSTLDRFSSDRITIENLAEDADGALLFGGRNGIQRVAAGSAAAAYLPGATRHADINRLHRDRDGGLWIGTGGQGLMHVHGERTDQFTRADGLSGDLVNRLFEDREGNIWVATLQGLDRFREFAIPRMSVKQGLSSDETSSVVAADDSVWVATVGGLNRWKNNHAERHGALGGRPSRSREAVTSLFRNPGGRLWGASADGLVDFENDRLIPVDGLSGSTSISFVEDAAGDLWFANQNQGLLRVSQNQVLERIPWVRLGHHDNALSVIADRKRGGLWLGFFQGGITHFAEGQIRASYGAAEGLGEGSVRGLQLDEDGTLWAATAGGLNRLKSGRIAKLTSKNGLPCDAVHWLMKDDLDGVWLYMACGLVRVPRADLDAWAADPKRIVQTTVFGASDGVVLRSIPGNYTPQVAKASDGRLWFVSGDGVSIVDPRHLPVNRLAPPVSIEAITADRTTYDATAAVNGSMRLPPLVRDLEIDYTALSLVAPEKNQFRYKLEGFDSDWQNAGNRRQAFYTNLSPGDYRFRVKAANNSGVWNEAGATLDFSIAPAYYQTVWFRTLVVVMIATLLWAAYRYRVRQVALAFDARLQERVNERTRIARDLHDTLLQSFHGLLFRFQAAANMLPAHSEARDALEDTIDRANSAITEARDAVQGLRLSAAANTDLASAIGTLAKELAAVRTGEGVPQLRVDVAGAPRDLAPLVRDEVFWIASEALRNAFRHAQAAWIEVDLYYDAGQFRLRVRDDGRGVSREVIESGGRAGHYGLAGMRERAHLVHGALSVWSELESGTEVELTIPASFAYATKSTGSWPVIEETRA
jgi:signal transduction histidine kinase/ligand-binding sensor domain-containing protein